MSEGVGFVGAVMFLAVEPRFVEVTSLGEGKWGAIGNDRSVLLRNASVARELVSGGARISEASSRLLAVA
jgi:hypothetical protein